MSNGVEMAAAFEKLFRGPMAPPPLQRSPYRRLA